MRACKSLQGCPISEKRSFISRYVLSGYTAADRGRLGMSKQDNLMSSRILASSHTSIHTVLSVSPSPARRLRGRENQCVRERKTASPWLSSSIPATWHFQQKVWNLAGNSVYLSLPGFSFRPLTHRRRRRCVDRWRSGPVSRCQRQN